MPSNLTRFEAEWVEPSDAVRDVVDTYWAVHWQLPLHEAVTQRIVDFPAITLSIESGDVPAPFVVTSVRPGAWSRVIRGSGSVFAIRLRPAGLRVLSNLDAAALLHEQELTHELDERSHRALHAIAAGSSVLDRAATADEIIRQMLQDRPITSAQILANSAVDALTASARVRSGRSIAAGIGTSERSLQRALRATIGIGPNEVARRMRLQEVIRRLSSPGADAAEIAGEMGYFDQAHLINEFRSVAGMTPGQYLRDVQRSLEELHLTPGATS
ncbi:helix-turn-helix domain-containing protein [Herbiconiux sp. CPCC 205763]|uniref:Helix-turn-helix domain-containing protein n=1 Tax=Herbiconiux aconitum TaxID=2970913 RepID=A0ABT2GN66_9MICO|nr:helix-turn-helix domain-containing protein [Herbiconiux aconitum]MCS5717673.1 helix-turn-helix domain-containing protein [Herbiconiux aconitum]